MIRNMAASVRQRLLDRSRQEQRPFQELLQLYVMERFLYRLSRSPHAQCFVLKGALMLQVWQSPQSRPTRDIDLLGHISNDPSSLLSLFRDVLVVDELDDGIEFDVESLSAEAITEEADYQGVRVLFNATLSGAKARLQIDIGFGDVVLPTPEWMTYPVLLDLPAPRLLCYSRESAIAEKFQAMVALGRLNSRMKDFYDIWLLSRSFDFELAPLKAAIVATFRKRNTELPARPLFSKEFSREKQPQWQAFIRRLDQETVEQDFTAVVSVLENFLGKVVEPGEVITDQYWRVGGPWQS